MKYAIKLADGTYMRYTYRSFKKVPVERASTYQREDDAVRAFKRAAAWHDTDEESYT